MLFWGLYWDYSSSIQGWGFFKKSAQEDDTDIRRQMTCVGTVWFVSGAREIQQGTVRTSYGHSRAVDSGEPAY